jgi:hypothetical protein
MEEVVLDKLEQSLVCINTSKGIYYVKPSELIYKINKPESLIDVFDHKGKVHPSNITAILYRDVINLIQYPIKGLRSYNYYFLAMKIIEGDVPLTLGTLYGQDENLILDTARAIHTNQPWLLACDPKIIKFVQNLKVNNIADFDYFYFRDLKLSKYQLSLCLDFIDWMESFHGIKLSKRKLSAYISDKNPNPPSKDKICRTSSVKSNAPYILDAYISGQTLQEIGDTFECSRENIRLILRDFDMSRNTGGAHVRHQKRTYNLERDKVLSKKVRVALFHGCSLEEYEKLKTVKPDPVVAYVKSKNASISRNIKWDISLLDWWNIWTLSGKWNQRGVGHGKFVMGRKNYDGAYEKDNVFVTECVGYISDYWVCISSH